MIRSILVLTAVLLIFRPASAQETPVSDRHEPLPKPGTVLVNRDREEVVLHAVVQHPKDKPCIGDWGQRVQAFAGCI